MGISVIQVSVRVQTCDQVINNGKHYNYFKLFLAINILGRTSK